MIFQTEITVVNTSDITIGFEGFKERKKKNTSTIKSIWNLQVLFLKFRRYGYVGGCLSKIIWGAEE